MWLGGRVLASICKALVLIAPTAKMYTLKSKQQAREMTQRAECLLQKNSLPLRTSEPKYKPKCEPIILVLGAEAESFLGDTSQLV